ncbi:MAG: hypothetical protein CK527_02680 [Nitrosarchaeum sp.]|nr:MAG: hypothetical protein CK527_02680 [Nitrosarchaeum sp.]
MFDTFDREKIIDSMFDPMTSDLLSEFEDGQKECAFLVEKYAISETEIFKKLSYLAEHGFVIKIFNDGKYIFSANTEKLTQFIEHNDTFNATIEGLEKMDSYLN